MGASYKLKDDGYKWLVIYRGRHKVGRVWQHVTTKKWHGMIGRDEATGETSNEAFRNVASKALGFESPEALRSHNAVVRHRNRQRNAHVRHLANEMLRGNFDALDELLGIPPKK